MEKLDIVLFCFHCVCYSLGVMGDVMTHVAFSLFQHDGGEKIP